VLVLDRNVVSTASGWKGAKRSLLGGGSVRGWVTQIMNRELLAPDVQEVVLGEGARGVTERELREVGKAVELGRQSYRHREVTPR
jgi:hypothetical protein